MYAMLIMFLCFLYFTLYTSLLIHHTLPRSFIISLCEPLHTSLIYYTLSRLFITYFLVYFIILFLEESLFVSFIHYTLPRLFRIHFLVGLLHTTPFIHETLPRYSLHTSTLIHSTLPLIYSTCTPSLHVMLASFLCFHYYSLCLFH